MLEKEYMSGVDLQSEDRPRKDDEELLKHTEGAATTDTSQDATLDEIELLQEKLEAGDKEFSGPSLKQHEHPRAKGESPLRRPRRA